ncbi:hypothetical protein [Clostridium sp. D53t1_180928_C8]|uniref:hypothetical protein n=1 Tax=Clostridium sp. D53t1_180928_C8 TaxID=2787101 RepID=UPI0018A96D82|nr:hypothetical protein [Clostridium sp. D53t1_180928_C8]
MSGLNWPGIVFFVLPILFVISGWTLVIIAEIVVQAIVITDKIWRGRVWERK